MQATLSEQDLQGLLQNLKSDLDEFPSDANTLEAEL